MPVVLTGLGLGLVFFFFGIKKDSPGFHYREKQRKPAMKGPEESVVELYLSVKTGGSMSNLNGPTT